MTQTQKGEGMKQLGYRDYIFDCCQNIMERTKALGAKGKKADDAALNYAVGYCAALRASEIPDWETMSVWITMILAYLGMEEIKRVVKDL